MPSRVNLHMDHILMHPFFEMSLDDQQRRISTAALVSPATYFLLRMVHLATRIKFPVTGPNEILFIDSIMAGMICYTCSHLRFLQCCGRMIIVVFFRIFCLFFLFCSIYMQPKWYQVHKNPVDRFICWGLIFIHVIATSFCITMCLTIFVQEQVYHFYNWNAIKTMLCPPRNHRRPPEYHDAIANNALPPSYEEAVGTRPPEYNASNTPPVISPAHSSVNIHRYNASYQGAVEEAETMF
uniref:Transmembrane protein n=1 Tax=Caenorhabditis tropicalis TaxID=1561998 RepID=A0A1I7TWG0_9PELO